MPERKVKQNPQPICSEEELTRILRVFLGWLEPICHAWRIDDPNEIHQIGHVMCECLMAGHGYNVDNFKPGLPDFVCNLIHEYHK